MNYDHLLTRVFDTQEKKMLYIRDEFYIANKKYVFEGIGDDELIISYISSMDRLSNIETIIFGDRYIPMLCSGRKDQNKKLIFDGDIIRIDPDYPSQTLSITPSIHLVEWGDDYPAFEISPLISDEYNNLQYVLLEYYNVEIIGDKFLNPDLLPKEQTR